ncbi:M20 family peptidase [Leptospira kmetyi]|uniref:M20 family peptidase n=1 Tax=Leptospira kmetyi TaxID=408139 RepID=UPI003EBBE8AF
MKRITQIAIVSFCILAFVCIFNTFRVRNVPPPVSAGENEIVPINEAVERLSKSIRFKTVSSLENPSLNADQFLALNRHIETSYPLLNSELAKTKIGDSSFFYEWKGSDPSLKPILLCAHSDVVDVEAATENLWTADPFGGEVRDGFVWGRGSWDDKSSLFAILESVEILIRKGFRPKRSVFIAVGQDEEVVYGISGAKSITDTFKKMNLRFEYVLDEGQIVAENIIPGIDKPVALVGIAGKGYLTVRLRVDLKEGGHSSMPPRETAIGILTSALHRLENSPFPFSLTPVSKSTFEWLAPSMNIGSRLVFSNLWLFGRILESGLSEKNSTRAQLHTTTAITKISGGFKDNVLPSQAEATVNFRILQGDTNASVLERISKIINDDRVRIVVPETIIEPSQVSATDSKSFESIRTAILRTIPDAVVAPALVSAYTDSIHYSSVSDNAYRFFPVRAKPDDLKRFHGIDERISVSNYEEIIRFYAEIIKNSNIQ